MAVSEHALALVWFDILSNTSKASHVKMLVICQYQASYDNCLCDQ